MLKEITLALDSTDKESWTKHKHESVTGFLLTRYETLPVNMKVYHKSVSKLTDVTPVTEADADALEQMEGPFFVVQWPAWQVVLIGAGLLAVAAVAFMSLPHIPEVATRNQTVGSPNNDLSDRSNRARINGRIPDIFGKVRSTPDLIASPYKIFENNNEIEYSLMCIGRGSYMIEDVRDGDTLCVNIPGTTIQVYSPYTSPNSGHEPQLRIGTKKDIPIIRTERSNSVSGQVLRPPNEVTFTGAGNVRFRSPNVIELAPSSPEDFTKYFVAGDVVTITDAVITAGNPVTEKLKCRATFVDLRVNVNTKFGVQSYTYECTGGALLFALGETADKAYGLFAPGDPVDITQVGFDTRYPTIDISGSYEVDSAIVSDASENNKRFGITDRLIVKLVSPEVENPDWEDLEHGGDSWDYLNQAAVLDIEVAHAGANVDYSLNLNGTFTIISVTKDVIVLDNPAGTNAQWNDIETEANGVTPFISPVIESSGEGRWVGPFIMTDPELQQLFFNFVAQNGIYKDDGVTQLEERVTIDVEVTPVDEDDEATGDPEVFSIELVGSAVLKETVAVTLPARLTQIIGRVAVRARRTSEHDETYEGQVVDEVRWRDLYSGAFIDLQSFGNVTIVQAITYATASALAVKERKLNMLVTRLLPFRMPDGSFADDALFPTEDAADIFVAICRDMYIGNRQLSEIDVDNIYDTVEAVRTYFGHVDPSKFSYTFDKDNLSFEETASIVAAAVFSIAYRRGNIIKMSFEKRTDDSTLLFNHRNKLPGSEKRSFSFGRLNDNDGIEYTYVNPKDDSVISVFLPAGYAAINPKKIESLGVRNHLQAYFQAWRAWNRILYQYLSTEFEATSEAELALKNDRILVADNTRSQTQDGYVREVNVLELTLSQAVDLTVYGAYKIFLLHYDGNSEAIDITAGSAPNKVILADAPAFPLVTDRDKFAQTAYIVVGNDEQQQTAFLLASKELASGLTSTVTAINYDDRYYANDPDFINDVIGVGGYGEEGAFEPAPEEPPYNDTLAHPNILVFMTADAFGGGVAGSIPSGFNNFADMGNVVGIVAGSVSGISKASIITIGETGGEVIIRLAVLTSELRANPDVDYWTSVDIAGYDFASASGSYSEEVEGDYTVLIWHFSGSDANAVATLFHAYPYKSVATFTVPLFAEGPLAVTEAADVAAISGVLKIAGALAATEAPDAAAIAGELELTGGVNVTAGTDGFDSVGFQDGGGGYGSCDPLAIAPEVYVKSITDSTEGFYVWLDATGVTSDFFDSVTINGITYNTIDADYIGTGQWLWFGTPAGLVDTEVYPVTFAGLP